MILSKRTQWSISILSVVIALYAFTVAYLLPSAHFSPIIEKLAHTPLPALVHFIGGATALILGLLQFNSYLRKHYLTWHKGIGTLYFIAVFSSGLGGLYIGMQAHGGIIAQSGFVLLALVWLLTAFLALKAILQKDLIKHRFWIYINFSLTLAAVTLRLQIPVGSALLGFEQFYPIVAWSCWLPNLYIAYRIVKQKKDNQ